MEKLLEDLAKFDQAAANSAKNFNSNFNIQLDALSTSLQVTANTAASSFNAAFLTIDAVVTTTAFLMNEVLNNSFLAITAGINSYGRILQGGQLTQTSGFVLTFLIFL